LRLCWTDHQPDPGDLSSRANVHASFCAIMSRAATAGSVRDWLNRTFQGRRIVIG
jgi:hypothetical protein